MPDLSLLGVLVLAVIGCLVYAKLRPRRPAAPLCPECRIPMEHDADAPASEVGGHRLPLGPTASFGEPRAAYYHCPRCGYLTRVTY